MLNDVNLSIDKRGDMSSLKGYRSQSFSDEELYQWLQEAFKRKREVDP